ncbi:MAG TPA: dipeptide epimerase [Chthonomonadaceae bacterium]|nr:dipeptide epimerase [Chthonomonadaceae bacterium]
MRIEARRFTLTKRYALTISRGTSAGSENLLVEVEAEGVTGFGEMAPYSGGAVPETAEEAEADIRRWAPLLAGCSPWEMQRIEGLLDRAGGGRGARAALDNALHDWQGKRVGLPVWKLLGLDRDAIPPTSLTVGINPPEALREIVPEILARTGARILKVKLGHPEGIAADQTAFAAAQEAATVPVAWRVDANGGWSVERARAMLPWLAARGVEFVEQPLARGEEAGLPAVHADSPLPIFVDESMSLAADIPPLAAHVDGVNLKLMKCGGLREALRIIHTARAHGLKVMIGCMSESSLAITAAAHLSPLADALDLDSHLNLHSDPFIGAILHEGRIVPGDAPGLGVQRAEG